MENRLGRVTRTVLAPRAVILGASAFQFGLALSGWARATDVEGPSSELYLELFLASTVLAASACLATKRAAGNLLAAFLCGPLPLLQPFLFMGIPHRSDVTLFSAAHFGRWVEELTRIPANIWLLTALSCAIFACAMAATLRPLPKP